LKILKRGYGVVTNKKNESIKSINNVNINDVINIKLTDGIVTTSVIEVKED